MISKSLLKKTDSIFETIYDLPGYQHLTDLGGKILCLNKKLIVESGVDESRIIGKTVFCEASRKYEKMYKKHETSVKKKRSAVTAYELAESHSGRTFLVLSHKAPFYCDGVLVGVFACSIEVPEPIGDSNISLSEDVFFFDYRRNRILQLTKKQRHVVFHLLQGLSAREVAEKMFLSKRTVEHHVEAIKDINGYLSTKEMQWSIRVF